MIKQKMGYESPTTELFVIRFEENIMSPNEYRSGGAGTYGLGEINENDDYE